jgi:hypothetical protein
MTVEKPVRLSLPEKSGWPRIESVRISLKESLPFKTRSTSHLVSDIDKPAIWREVRPM